MRIKPFLLLLVLPMLSLGRSVQANPLLVYAAQTEPGGPFSLYSTIDGGRTAPLSVQNPIGGPLHVLEFDFAPHDSNVVYRAYPSSVGPTELYLGRPLVSSPGWRISASLATGRSVANYALSRDTSSIAYIADGQSAGVFEVYTTDLEGSLPVQKVNATPVSGGNVIEARVSPDGRWMAYRGDLLQDEKFEVFASAIPTTSTWQIYPDLAADEDVANCEFSPDSTRLAILVRQSFGGEDFRHRLYTRAIQGTGVTTPIADAGEPFGNIVDYRFSPSGSNIALLEDRDSIGKFELYLANADGTGATVKINSPMGANKDVQTIAFSPDGQWLAYKSNVSDPTAAQGELYLYSMTGAEAPAKVNQDELGNVGHFAFSPDSQYLIYQQAPEGVIRSDLHARPTSLVQSERKINGLAPAAESIEAFTVGAQSQHVAYIGVQAGIGTLYLAYLDSDGSERRVNPSGQSVAAILAAPVNLSNAADSGWNIYR